MAGVEARIESVAARAYRVPTDAPEADGTLRWSATTLVVAEVKAAGHSGLGLTYADAATALIVRDPLAGAVRGLDALALPHAYEAMCRAVRNLGRAGVCSMAISAVDIALWDLKAKLLDLPLFRLLGAAREAVPVYGSGGFTSYSLEQLQAQLGGWVESGIRMVKMKVGEAPDHDVGRVRAAREVIGPGAGLFVDANGAYARKQALALAERFAELGVSYFEEPVSSDDLAGLRLLRDRAPSGMAIAAGEYGYDPFYFRRMLEAGAVDILQADATRCGGVTGFLQAAQLAAVHGVLFSAHTSPTVHMHAGCAAPAIAHVEYFHDHARIERLLLDGAQVPREGALHPDPSRPGLGVALKGADAERYAL